MNPATRLLDLRTRRTALLALPPCWPQSLTVGSPCRARSLTTKSQCWARSLTVKSSLGIRLSVVKSYPAIWLLVVKPCPTIRPPAAKSYPDIRHIVVKCSALATFPRVFSISWSEISVWRRFGALIGVSPPYLLFCGRIPDGGSRKIPGREFLCTSCALPACAEA